MVSVCAGLESRDTSCDEYVVSISNNSLSNVSELNHIPIPTNPCSKHTLQISVFDVFTDNSCHNDGEILDPLIAKHSLLEYAANN